MLICSSAFRSGKRRQQQAVILRTDKQIRADGKDRQDRCKDREIQCDEPRDHVANLYPTPHTVTIRSRAPAVFSLRRSWLIYTSTMLLEPSNS